MNRTLLVALFACCVGCGASEEHPSGVVVVGPEAAAPASPPPAPGAEAPAPPASSPGSGEADPPPPAAEPPVEPLGLEVTSPLRGVRTREASVQVTGVVTGGLAPALTVADQTVELGADGSFSVEVPVTRGLHVLSIQAKDGTRVVEERRAVLVRAGADPEAPVRGGISTRGGNSPPPP